jgi:hypothetical protein
LSAEALPHWLSFKQKLLPFLVNHLKIPGSQMKEIWDQSLKEYPEIDWYGFQTTSIFKFIGAYMAAVSNMYGKDNERMFRLLCEEAYAVLSFERAGCKVIRPSPQLVTELIQTDATYKLVDIRPPAPHVYIELPAEAELFIPDPDINNTMRPVLGVHVTWAETGAVTREWSKRSKEAGGLVVTPDGRVMNRNETDDPGAKPLGTESDSVFGDWFARFLGVSSTPEVPIHGYTQTYYNMHWSNSEQSDAAGAYKQWCGTWEKSPMSITIGMAEQAEMRNKLFNLAANLFLYMSMPKADMTFTPSTDRETLRQHGHQWNNKRRKRLKNKIREEMPVEVWVVGQHIVLDRNIERADTGPSNAETPGSSPKTHWRRGHWHSYWTGPRDGDAEHRKLEPRWIRPILVLGRGEAPASTTYEVK